MIGDLIKHPKYTHAHKLRLSDRPGNEDFFTCGLEDHLARDCEQNEAEAGNQQKDKVKGSRKSAKVSSIHNSGLFISALANGKSINCLLDTAATLTMISTKVWGTLCHRVKIIQIPICVPCPLSYIIYHFLSRSTRYLKRK